MLNRLLILFGIAFFLNKTGNAQDAEFSQFYANPLYLNPALTGAEICPRLVINYRNQWPGLDNNFVNYTASYDQYIDKLHGGAGILMNVDNIGEGLLRSSQVSLIYAYTLHAAEFLYFNMALQATFCQKYLNWELLQFEDQIDLQHGFTIQSGETPPDYTTLTFPDFDAGVVFGWKDVLHGGMAFHHLTEPNMAFYVNNEDKLPLKLTGHLGANIYFRRGGETGFEPVFYVAPNILYQQQGNFHQLNAGIYVIRLPLVIGTWFRHNFENADAFIVLVGINYKNLKIGYSYDITLSKLKSLTGGAHEISVAWQFKCIEKLRKLHPYNAPGF
jgi:type IX secretion system PorP/SprF family membrane protein